MTQISVTRALAELKKFDNQIEREIRSGTFLAITIGKDTQKKVLNSQDSVETVKAKIQGTFDSIESLMKRRDELKGKLVLSNATTRVQVAGRDITVAEAIEFKKSIANRQMLVSQLQSVKFNANSQVQTLNAKVEETIEKNLSAVYGSEKGKLSDTDYAAIANPQKNAKEAAILEVVDVATLIDEMTKTIEAVNTELDFILSEQNARTLIDVSW